MPGINFKYIHTVIKFIKYNVISRFTKLQGSLALKLQVNVEVFLKIRG